jgi:hypothetical protein
MLWENGSVVSGGLSALLGILRQLEREITRHCTSWREEQNNGAGQRTEDSREEARYVRVGDSERCVQLTCRCCVESGL